jgi:predicted outer membrane protein
MNVQPGKVNDGMAIKPAPHHDGMSVLSDTAFLAKNIKDNLLEIQLSKLAQAKSTSPTVKRVAGIIRTNHTAILNDLLKLSPAKPGNGADQAGEMPMPTLPNGTEFEAAWAGEMLKMHEVKIIELETFIGLTKNEALKAVVIKAIPKIKAQRALLLKIPGANEKSKMSNII